MKTLCIYFSFVLVLVGNSLHLSTANALTFGKNKTWIQTEEGAINLNYIHMIKAVISSTITYPRDSEEDLFKTYRQPLSQKDISAVTSWFSPESRNEDAFYKLKVEAFLMLDSFRLNLFESETFVKKPPKTKKVTIRPEDITIQEYAYFGRTIIFGTEQEMAFGKGRCPICHAFVEGSTRGGAPNLVGINERARVRVKEDHYLNHPIKVGEKEPDSGIIKGSPKDIPAEYRREGSAGHDGLFSGSVYGDDFQDGLDAYKRKDYKTAYILLFPFAEKGNLRAKRRLKMIIKEIPEILTGVDLSQADLEMTVESQADLEMTAEDYIRESMMCPGCYVVKGYGESRDTKSSMPISTKSPINLTPVEVNAVIAYLQSFISRYNKLGDYSDVTVPLPQKPIETVAELSGKSKIFSEKIINDKENKITQKKYKEITDSLNTALKFYNDLINN